MRKKLLVIIVVMISLIGYVIFNYSKPNVNTSSQKELSERSKEFLKKQQAQGNLAFGGVDSSGKQTKSTQGGSEIIDIGQCFRLSIPFPIEDNKKMGECFHQISVTSPRAIINVYSRDVSYASLEDDSGVKMRRTESKTYKEEKITVKGNTFITFKKTDAGYEKTALYLSGGKLIGINLLSNMNDDTLDMKFSEMLQSVEFK